MHNIKYLDINKYVPKNILHDVGQSMRNGKNHRNRDNYTKNEIELNSKFDEYSQKALENNLEGLSSPLNLSREESASIRSLYESGKSVQQIIWAELTKLNNNQKIVCPICGENFAEELDHYVPREIYPEFSIHILNLIPTCHYCNRKKHTAWLDANGKRIIFNAYFDTPTTDFIYNVDVVITNNYPYLSISIDNTKLADPNNYLEVSTASQLNLCGYYESIANKELERKISKIKDTSKLELMKFNNNRDDYWKNKIQIFNLYICHAKQYKVSDILAYKAMTNPILGDWIKKII